MNIKIKHNLFCTFIISLILIVGNTVSSSDEQELQVVPKLDLDRFQGTWYEIAHNPWFVQKDCFAMIAHYKLVEDGKIKVTNICRDNGFDGKVSQIEGKAWVVEEKTQAKWKVQFIWPFKLNYWVIEVGEDYQYAVVGEPDKENVWILSRQPHLDKKILDKIIDNTKAKGYDLTKIVWTPHHPQHSQCLAKMVADPSVKSNSKIC
jgi:apolipoprotein D and lipocalin family protein